MKTIAVYLAVLAASSSAFAQGIQTDDEQNALAELFADRHVAESALDVHRRAMALPFEKRFEYLLGWVMPSADHATVRLALDFTSAYPAPVVAENDPVDLRRLEIAEQKNQSRTPTGANLVAPALDLIEAARELGKLDQLRQQASQLPAADNQQSRTRLALLALIDLARGDSSPAVESLFQLFALVEASDYTEFSQRWPETLAAHAGLRHPATRDVARDLTFHLYFRQTRSGPESGSEAWRRQMLYLAGLAKHYELKTGDASIEHFSSAPELKQWSHVARSTAKTRGAGYPPGHWQVVDGNAECLFAHDDDYLYFQSPLRGNFEVECDLPAFGWRDMQVAIGGHWAALSYDQKSYSVGGFRSLRGKYPLTSPMTPVGDSLHYRIVVRDGVAKTFVNGHPLHDEPLPAEFDPWLAIRNNVYSAGTVRNFRIMGSPDIPAEIQLSQASDLRGWYAYHEGEIVGVDWKPADAATGSGIQGVRRYDLDETAAESLLRYHRPMLENGTIEYEFFYRDGETLCHPAIDRLAFLLEPSGVRVHWITDGLFDRTGLSSENTFDEPENRRGSGVLPLINDAWNRLAVSLEGNTVQLALNGQAIYERPLERTNQRVFGLFHYADRTEARARNIVWRGDWPRELPPVAEQELIGDYPGFLNERLPELTAVFEHDFTKDGFSLDQFSITEGDPTENFSHDSDGLHANRVGKQGYSNATVVPRLSIHGDFDITAKYDNFQSEVTKDGAASVIMQFKLNNAAADECLIYRRASWRSDKQADQQFQSSTARLEDGQTVRSFSPTETFEATSGSLRLARRGDMVYFLIAEGDSPNFRLVRSQKVGAEDVKADAVRMIVQAKEAGRAEAVWKSLSVRAEGLDGLALEDPKLMVAELDRQRAELPQQYVHDFLTDQSATAPFHRWGFTFPETPTPDGLHVVPKGSDGWSSAGLSPQVAVRGDFDVSFEFEVLKADLPKPAKSSAVYLQVDMPDEARTQTSVIHSLRDNGRMYAVAQARYLSPDGATYSYPNLRQEMVTTVQRMRLARRGARIFYLCSEGGSQRDRLLARFDASDIELPPGAIHMLAHTGGGGKLTEVAFKKITVRAVEILNQPGIPNPPPM